MKIVLGIETSCDETSVAIIRSDKTILSNQVVSQLKEHAPFGGVVPEIAARAHIQQVDRLIRMAVEESNIALTDIDGVAVASGPGLIGGLIVGVMAAKGLAYGLGCPLIGVNHLEGHALTVRLTDDVSYPYLLLLVSGGHCQFVWVNDLGDYDLLGGTIDDAVGEAFDKVGKMMGFGYPSGPIIEAYAKDGDPKRCAFPRALCDRPGCDFSFSGLKTAVLREVEKSALEEQDKRDIAASFQETVGDIMANRLRNALSWMKENNKSASHLVVAGGVAANLYLRERLTESLASSGMELKAPPIKLCTDNAAMIAWAGYERLEKGYRSDFTLAPKARWPL